MKRDSSMIDTMCGICPKCDSRILSVKFEADAFHMQCLKCGYEDIKQKFMEEDK